MHAWISEKINAVHRLLAAGVEDVTLTLPLPELHSPVLKALEEAKLSPLTVTIQTGWRKTNVERAKGIQVVGICMQTLDILQAWQAQTTFVHLPPLIEWIRAKSVPTFRLALREKDGVLRFHDKAALHAFLVQPRTGDEVIYDGTNTLIQLLVHQLPDTRIFLDKVIEATQLYQQTQDFLLGPRDALPIVGAKQVYLSLKHTAQLLGRLDLILFTAGIDHAHQAATAKQQSWLSTHASWLKQEPLLGGQAQLLIETLIFRRDNRLATIGQMIKILQLGGDVHPHLTVKEASDWVENPPPTPKQEAFLRKQGLWEDGIGRYAASKKIAALTEPKPVKSADKIPWSHTKVLL
jgi:hypothetical protein